MKFIQLKKIYLQLCLVFISLFAGATTPEDNNGIIRGVVLTSDSLPAESVTVVMKELDRSVLTATDGSFLFRNIKPGTYIISISLVGYENAEYKVDVQAGKTSELRLHLKLLYSQLEEVILTSTRNKFYKSSSATVARLPLKNLENPQVYNNITAQLMKEQVITNVDDAMKNAPGLDKLWSSTGRAGDGAAYYSLRGFSVQPGIINGVAGISNAGLDPANIENIEVIKGPSGTLFGSSLASFGGLININTKKPYDSTGGEISLAAGSFGLTRITSDYNTSLDKQKKALLRINGAYHYENSFQDAGFRKSFFIAPSLSYKVNNRLSFNLNTEFLSVEGTSPASLFLNRTRKLVATNPDELGIRYDRSFTSNDVTMRNPTTNVWLQMNYKISSKWTSQTIASISNRKSDGYYQYSMFLLPGDTLLSRLVSKQLASSYATNLQQNFIGDFSIGKMRNRVVIGLDYLETITDNNNSAYITFDTINTRRADPKYTNLNRTLLDARFVQNNNPTRNLIKSSTYSAYISDVLNITPSLLAMMSVRIDHFNNKGTYNLRTDITTGAFEQTAVSPKFGLMYQLLPSQLSLFSNYMNGFRNVAALTQPDGTVSNFKPQQANQWEAGVKMEILKGRLNVTLSYYNIFVSNITRPDPDRAGFTIQDGNVYSRGFEADIAANLLPGLSIIAGYSYNSSMNDKTDAGSIGRRPVTAGPQNLANAWISYSPVQGKLKGWSIGFGGNYASENIITNSLATGEFTLPAYTVMNTTLYYNTNSYRIAFKLDNITNQYYYKGWTTVEPQRPRSFTASVAFKF